MALLITPFLDQESNTFSYLVACQNSRQALVIDPVLNFDAASGRTRTAGVDEICDAIRQHGYQLQYILETHVHADHITGSVYLKQQCGGVVGIGAKITEVQHTFGRIFHLDDHFSRDGRQFDLLLEDNQQLSLGEFSVTVLHTPGHTPACVSYLIADALFVGDTIFMPDFGTARCDFPGGDAETLYHSISRLFALPEATRMFMCHDYGTSTRKELAWQTTVGEQKQHNIHVGEGRCKEAFVQMRRARDATLAMPKLLLPSVQLNMRAGHAPEPEANGVSYLKLPLDLL